MGSGPSALRRGFQWSRAQVAAIERADWWPKLCCRMGWLDPEAEACEQLARLLPRVRYKDGWTFRVENWGGRYGLQISIETVDSVSGKPTIVMHRRPLHPLRDEREARHWLIEQIFAVERHEAMEFFSVDGAAPFFPDHESMPYAMREREVPVPIHREADDRYAVDRRLEAHDEMYGDRRVIDY